MAQAADAAAIAAGVPAAAAGETMMGAEKLEEPDHSSSNWYFPREHIEKNSPSRMDRIDLKKETYFRKSYCTFLQDLGMRLKVPQVTIATSIVFCHRFFLRQSHAKNDRYLIATSCMFLAGKVEETPQKLCDVIFLSYEIRNKKDPTAVQRIKQKEVYEPQKELVLLGERLVLTTLGFDLNIHHPYKPLVAAIKKFKVAQNALAQVAWNFVNDGLRTSLCLQFKPHHIAAGAIFLAAKFLKVKLPSEGEKVWWQEFEVTPRQLEEVSNQMLELYEQNRESPASRASDPSTSMAANNHNRAAGEAPASSSVQVSEKRSVADSKGRGNAKRSGDDEDLPMPIETPDNAAAEQETWIGSSTKSDARTIPTSILASENSLIEETKSRTADANCSNGEAANLDSLLMEKTSAGETEPSAWVKDGGTSPRIVSSTTGPPETEELPKRPEAEEPPKRKPKESIDGSRSLNGSLVACTQVSDANVSAVVEGGEQIISLPHASQPKPEFVEIADINIDRVKAAIQRRKKGDKRPVAVKRELTDEEELLEMELENGHEPVYERGGKKQNAHHVGREGSFDSNMEAEELLEMSFENVGKGKLHERNNGLKREHEQRFYAEFEGGGHRQQVGDGERQDRDHKKPRVDHGK